MPRVGDTYPDRWMKASHLEEMNPDAENYVFTITDSGETIYNDGKKQIFLKFAETRLELGLNKGNAELCQDLFSSDDSDDWVGRRIALHVEIVRNSMVPGGKSPAIRVSSKATRLANRPPSKKPAPPVTQQEADGDIPLDDDIPDDIPF